MPFKYGECVSIAYCAAEFYLLEALNIMLDSNRERCRHSHERLYKDLLEHKEHFETMFAYALRDYLTYAVAGEARNGRDHATGYIGQIPQCSDRSGIVGHIELYTPESIAMATKEAFDDANIVWKGGYGGERWKNIAEAILLYKRLPRTAWIDHCVDLSHNNGSCFNKSEYHIFAITSGFTSFLDDKTCAQTPIDLLRSITIYGLNYGLSPKALELLHRFQVLRLFRGDDCMYDALVEQPEDRGIERQYGVHRLLVAYEPICWGTNELVPDWEEGSWCGEIESVECNECQNYSCGNHPTKQCDGDGHDCCECYWDGCSNHPSQAPSMCYECENDDCEYYMGETKCQYCNEVTDDCECVVCSACGHVVYHDCECERCSECGELIDDCDCERCSQCHELVDECRCIKCYDCGMFIADCECAMCNNCNEKVIHCKCPDDFQQKRLDLSVSDIPDVPKGDEVYALDFECSTNRKEGEAGDELSA